MDSDELEEVLLNKLKVAHEEREEKGMDSPDEIARKAISRIDKRVGKSDDLPMIPEGPWNELEENLLESIEEATEGMSREEINKAIGGAFAKAKMEGFFKE